MPKTKKVFDDAEDDFELIIDREKGRVGVKNVTTGEEAPVSFGYAAMKEIGWLHDRTTEALIDDIDGSIAYELYHFLDGYEQFKTMTSDEARKKW